MELGSKQVLVNRCFPCFRPCAHMDLQYHQEELPRAVFTPVELQELIPGLNLPLFTRQQRDSTN